PVVVEKPVVVEEPVVEENSFFSDVPVDHPLYDAVIFLTDSGIVEGYDDGTFRPEQTVNRVEALKFILEITKAELKDGELPFKDTPADEWYVSYLYTGYLKKIVEGNPDGTFKPGSTVNRAEFFKILFNGLNVDVNPNVNKAPYLDVSVDDWFAPYIAYAKVIGLLDADVEYIYPSAGMSRGDTADAMYRLVNILDK
ncbi:MAG: S-layer homology domain-containing protein, partial [bacterium]|nr:S-layer homology domain-containing protein [bacterium]